MTQFTDEMDVTLDKHIITMWLPARRLVESQLQEVHRPTEPNIFLTKRIQKCLFQS